jgi:hypothetical protein
MDSVIHLAALAVLALHAPLRVSDAGIRPPAIVDDAPDAEDEDENENEDTDHTAPVDPRPGDMPQNAQHHQKPDRSVPVDIAIA